ncbi:MAG: hypothetical protein R3A13_08120 [Bdellovibrionota bacterium]
MGLATTVRTFQPTRFQIPLNLLNVGNALVNSLPAIGGLSLRELHKLKNQLDAELDKIQPSLFYLGEKIIEFQQNSPIRQVFIDDTHGRLLGIFVHKLLESLKISHRAIYLKLPSKASTPNSSRDFLENLKNELSRFSGHSLFVTDLVSSGSYSGFTIECLMGTSSRVSTVSTFFSNQQALIDLNSRWITTEGIWRSTHTRQSLFDRLSSDPTTTQKKCSYHALSQSWLHHRSLKNSRDKNQQLFLAYSRSAIEKIATDLATKLNSLLTQN